MKLYDYGASCNCYKVRLLLANLGREYERVPVDIFGGDTLTDEYGLMNPARTTPVLELEDGRFLQESAAILVYLAEGTALWPRDSFDRAQALRWLVYEQTDVIPATGGLRFRLITGRLQPDDPDARRRRAAGEEILSLLDTHLGPRDFVVGAGYSVADIALYGYLHVAEDAGYELDPYPNVRRWFANVAAQPGYMNDLEPYPDNAWPGVGTSIYDY